MKHFRVFICLLLSVITANFAVACGNKNYSFDANRQKGAYSLYDSQNTESDAYVVYNGSSQYKIVVPENLSAMVSFAANELETFFAEATGVHLTVINDSRVSFTEESKFFSIGETSLLEQANVKVADDLGRSGAQLETVGNSVFMVGQTDFGALYAVYDFLAEMFNFEYFGNECYSLNRGVSQAKLINFTAYKDIPTIERRMSTSGINTYNLTEMYRFRQEHFYTSTFATINTLPWHNSEEYIKNQSAGHESYWYSDDKTQLCFTAHGNSNEYELMQQACLDSLKQMVIDYPHLNAATFSILDSATFCACSACSAIFRKYGCNSASCLLFCNDLRTKLEAWFNTAEGAPHKREFTLFFFAYMGTTDAPARYNAGTGKWEAIDGIHCADGVGVFYAPIDTDFMRSIYSEQNKRYLNAFDAWNVVSDVMYCWTYDWDFQSYFAPFDTFDTLQDLYKCFAEHGVKYIFQEGGHYMKEGASCWEMLKMYLNSKLAWNYKESVNELIDRFFEYFYGPVATDMREIFDEYRILSAYLKNNYSDYGGVQSNQKSLYETKWWPKQTLLLWNTQFNNILDNLESIKSANPTLYEQVRKRVFLEQMSPIYLLIRLYGTELDSGLLSTLQAKFKSCVELWDISKGDHGDDIKETYKTLGIK